MKNQNTNVIKKARKTRSDKGKKRGSRGQNGYNVTSKSSNAAIKKMIKKVNSVIDTYRIPASPDISNAEASSVLDYTASKVQKILSFDVKGEKLSLVDNHIPETDESAEYIRKVLKRQEDADAVSKEQAKNKGKTYVESKKLNELLKAIPTFSKKIDEIQKQLENTEKYVNISGGQLVAVPEHQGKNIARRQNRDIALKELVARSNHDWKSEGKIEDMIDRLYDDQEGNADLIAELNSGKWDGELIEKVNLRAMGIDVYNPFSDEGDDTYLF